MNILILSAGTRNKIIQYFKKEFKNIGSAKTIDITPKKEVTNHVTSTNNPIFFQ